MTNSRTMTADLDLTRRVVLTGLPAAAVLLGADSSAPAMSPTTDPSVRTIPARSLRVPETVSPALRAFIAAPYPPGWNDIPKTAADWKTLVAESAAAAASDIAEIRRRFDIKVEESMIAGVRVFAITPADLPTANRDRVLLHLHGGGYVLYPGEAGAGEGMLMAAHGRFKVISVDYRMPPDFSFPVAVDDAIAVWRALLAHNDAKRMGVFGSSAGGGLTLSMLLRARAEGLALPGAIATGTPWVDLTDASDSLATNEFVDNILVSKSGWLGAAASLYANKHDLRDPAISPIYGDMTGFPPAILTSGTRDLLLSDTVRTHRKLRRAGVEAQLQVFEGQSHGQYLFPFVPETEEAFHEIAQFLAAHLEA